jgi:hypothetical protein
MLIDYTAIWFIFVAKFGIDSLSPFGIFHGYLVYFLSFWYVAPRKIWQPWARQLNATTISESQEGRVGINKMNSREQLISG